MSERRPARVAPVTALIDALPVWLASRVAVALIALGVIWTDARRASDVPSFVSAWDHWDVGLYTKIAKFGYFTDAYPDKHTEVFFPGQPWALRAVHAFVPDWVLSGLLISLVAGAAMAVALWLLAARDGGPVAGRHAVTLLVLFPYAVFLFAGYSEALFCAFAFWAWYCGRQGNWLAAGVLAALAAGVRITGVPLGAALAVEYWMQARGRSGSWWRGIRADCLWLLAPAGVVAGYFTWLHHRTGRWDAYAYAEQQGWGRDTVNPLQAFRTTWRAANNGGQYGSFTWSFRAEIVAMLVGVALVVTLLVLRRWSEAAFVGSNVAILSVSAYYASGVRAMMTWFPLFVLLGQATSTRPWLYRSLVWLSAPLMAVFVMVFVRGGWVG